MFELQITASDVQLLLNDEYTIHNLTPEQKAELIALIVNYIKTNEN